MPDLLDAPGRDRPVDYGALTGSLGFLLRLSQLQSFAEFYDDLGGLDVRPGEITVLMMIGENPGIRQGVLARALMTKRAHMAKMARAMEAAGLITRTVPDDDRRAMQLRLTAQGRNRLAALRAPFLAHENRKLPTLGKTETETLKRLLRKYLALDAAGKDPR